MSAGKRYQATHLARDNKAGCLSVDKSREAICEDCNARITLGTDGIIEYGHAYDCPHRPDHLPYPPRHRCCGGDADGV